MLEQWFADKVAVITGGADGIGRAAAILLARRGAKVAIADINAAGGEETCEMVRSDGGTASFHQTDVASAASIGAFIDAAVATYGRLDIAFNNAGITHNDDPAWGEEAYNRTIAINLNGVYECMRRQIPHLLESGGGAIVNTSSIHGFIANPDLFLPAYTASKHGVIGLTKAVAIEYVKRNIRVNAVCPGVTATAMVRQVMARDEAARKMIEAHAPIGRVAEPVEVAEAAVWLASPAASFVTGHALVVDGGFLSK